MKILFVLPILLSLPIPYQQPSSSDSPLTVVNFKWSRARRTVEKPEAEGNAPARAMIPQNRNFARNARINDPRGARDPNQDTLDGRSEAIEKSVAESRNGKGKPSDGFAYKIKVQNAGPKVIDIVFWEYQFNDPADPSLVARRHFLCGVNIPAEKSKELEGFSLSGPGVVNAQAESPIKEKAVINRVEYADGSIWQRKDWNMAEVKTSYERVLREQWVPGMCKGL
jgi:hypothetical protein